MSDESRALRSATRRLAVMTAAAVSLALLVVGALVLAVVLREQRGEGTAALARAVSDVDDVADQPAGVQVWQRRSDGTVRRSPGAPGWLPVRPDVAAVGPDRPTLDRTVSRAGDSYLLRTAWREGTVVQASWSNTAQQRERDRVLTAVLVAELVGLALSAVIGLTLARRAIRPLSDAVTRQRRFVADASHELRTPLTLLTTRAQLLERTLRRGTDPVAHASSEALVTDARRLGDVVSDLLLAASLDAHPHLRERVDVHGLACAAVAAAQPHAAEQGRSLRVAGDDVGPSGRGDVDVLGAGGALRRVVDALVDNAVGHAPAGGHVVVEVERAGPSVLLRVRDDGPGIDPAVADRLFERFAHAPGPAGSSRAGFGLGLALVHEVVQAHGGTVAGRTAAGGGAVFEVRLPAAPPAGRSADR